MAETLVLSDVGLQAINNASAGGQLVDAMYFRIGDSAASPNKKDATDILGKTLFDGSIHHVEVLNKNTARFVFELRGYLIKEDTLISEMGVYLSNRTLLGRIVFDTPYMLIAGETVRWSALLSTTRCDLSTINVSIGDYSSIPMTPYVHQLPSPIETTFNALTVLDGLLNEDGSTSPVLVMKYGAGSFQWAFASHTRIYFGKPKAATPTTVTLAGLDLEPNESLIVHFVSGNGQGKTRRMTHKDGVLTEANGKPVTGLDSNTTVAVWQAQSGAGGVRSACSYPPSMDNVPADWVLTRGNGKCPVWGPPRSGGSNNSTLFRAPSRLLMNTVSYSGTGDTARFSLGSLAPDNVNYIHPMLSGVTQHRSAFDFAGNEVEFVENIDVDIPVEFCLFTRQPSNGSRMLVKADYFVGDGKTQTYKLSQPIENANYVKAYLRGIRQSQTTFTYDAKTQSLTFVAAIPAGIDVELRSFRFEDLEGYSTQITSRTLTTSDDTLFIELPLTPQAAEYVEITQSGAHIHGNLYTLVDNKVIFAGAIRKGLEVEIIIYDSQKSQGSATTSLDGVVVDAVLAGRSLKLLRHNDIPISLPIPGVSLEAGNGIRITGEHPFYRIESTLSEKLTNEDANFRFAKTQRLADTGEILLQHRINLSSDVMIAVHADFSAQLGPGFETVEGLEVMEYVVGFRSSKSMEPEYGLQKSGTGSAGFSALTSDRNSQAFSNASLTQTYDIVAENYPAGYIDVIVKMRVQNANITQYGSQLSLNVNIIGTAKLS